MSDKSERLCPVEKAGGLDTKIRRWLQNPRKILRPYIEEGMTVLDLGCGPGFFSIELAKMVGKSGLVIASDLQEGMLQKLRDKIQGTEVEKIIRPHKCGEGKIGVSDNVDFVLAFYMVHEVPNKEAFLGEIHSILKPNGLFLIVEPRLFHVTKKDFEKTISKAKEIGFVPIEQPRVFLGWSMIFGKG